MELCTLLIGLAVLVVFLIAQKFWRLNAYLSSLGVPVDRGTPFFKQNFLFCKHDVECLNKFGTVWARLDGVTPVLVVAEPDLIKEILVKKFDKFTNRSDFGVEERHLTVFDAQDEKWKSIRKSLSPIFTSGKLKGMMTHIDGVADNMIKCLQTKMEKSPGGAIDIKETFQGLALDTISNCAFGIETNSFQNPENGLFQRCLQAFVDIRMKNHLDNLMMTFFSYFPFILKHMDAYGKPTYDYFNKVTQDVMDSRKDNSRGDFIDRLREMMDETKRPGSDRLVSEENIVAQGSALFVAGFETSSNTLSTLAYNLAKHPDVQERIAEEVKAVLDDFDGQINYDTIHQMPYLEAVIEENLRMYSPAVRLDRVCSEHCTIGPYNIKKGTLVQLPFYAMHYNSKFFPEPEKFQPERFLKSNENKVVPFSHLPFGGGPRVCIGQRFAMVEMKIAMAKLLARFRIVATPETKLEPLKGDPFLFSYDEIRVKLEPRTF